MEGACGGGGYSVTCPHCGKSVSVFHGMKECPFCGGEIKEDYIKNVIREDTKKSFKYIWHAIVLVPIIFLLLYIISDHILK
jgi:hypothetical protein